MRLLLLTTLVFGCLNNAITQPHLYSTNKGEVRFFSRAPLEDISAENKTAVSFINTNTKEVVVRITVSNFNFPNKLMQEHFNENYLETDRFPNATFQGLINENVDWKTPGRYAVSATGVLNMHGKTQPKTLGGTMVVSENSLLLTCTFEVPLADFNIKIPKLLFSKIAEKIEVNCRFDYAPYVKR